MSRKNLLIGGAVVAAAVLGVLALRGGEPIDDRQAVLNAIDRAIAAVEARKLSPLAEMILPAYRDDRGHRRKEILDTFRLHFLRGGILSVYVIKKDASIDADDPQHAKATLTVVLTRTPKVKKLSDLVPDAARGLRFELGFRKDDGEWKLESASWRKIGLEGLLTGP